MLNIAVQTETSAAAIPAVADFEGWAQNVLKHLAYTQHVELAIRIVDEEEGFALNEQYRGKEYATNVLSFPVELPDALHDVAGSEDFPLPLGDLVICAPVVIKEAKAQDKEIIAHWAHLTTHGLLHLMGYDHVVDEEAEKMEALEVELLAKLGFSNPY